jgi:hypothetical protein
MRAREIAETIVNGNVSDARREILSGRTQAEAAVMALDVLEELWELLGAEDFGDVVDRLRGCLRGAPGSSVAVDATVTT